MFDDATGQAIGLSEDVKCCGMSAAVMPGLPLKEKVRSKLELNLVTTQSIVKQCPGCVLQSK